MDAEGQGTIHIKNPAGTIPTMEDPDTGYTLGEAHAIMAYLCNKHGWTDVYPADPEGRGQVDWYLNYHHRNLRDASVGLVAPKIRKDLDIPEMVQQSAQNTLKAALKALDTGWLGRGPYLTGENLSIADFAAYVEIGQLQPGFTNVFEFGDYPNVQAWLETMKQVPGHDEVHVVLAELGDISVEAPAMETIKNANISALKQLKASLSEL